jgi:hypothetical protein
METVITLEQMGAILARMEAKFKARSCESEADQCAEMKCQRCCNHGAQNDGERRDNDQDT